MRIFPGAIAAAFAVASVAVMRPGAASAQSAPPALTKVVFSLDFIPLGRHAPWYAAIAEGFFKEEGLDVSIIPSQGGAQVIQNVASGTANLGFMGVPEVAIAARRAPSSKSSPSFIRNSRLRFSACKAGQT